MLLTLVNQSTNVVENLLGTEPAPQRPGAPDAASAQNAQPRART